MKPKPTPLQPQRVCAHVTPRDVAYVTSCGLLCLPCALDCDGNKYKVNGRTWRDRMNTSQKRADQARRNFSKEATK